MMYGLFNNLPIYGLKAVFGEIGIGGGEMSAAVESAIDGEGRWMGGLEDEMLAAVDELSFSLRV